MKVTYEQLKEKIKNTKWEELLKNYDKPFSYYYKNMEDISKIVDLNNVEIIFYKKNKKFIIGEINSSNILQGYLVNQIKHKNAFNPTMNDRTIFISIKNYKNDDDKKLREIINYIVEDGGREALKYYNLRMIDYSRFIYILTHGKINDDNIIDHIDGNAKNNDINNLQELPRLLNYIKSIYMKWSNVTIQEIRDFIKDNIDENFHNLVDKIIK